MKRLLAFTIAFLMILTAIPSYAATDEELMRQGPGVYHSATQSSFSNVYTNGWQITLNPNWTYADMSVIHTGAAVMYKATTNRKGKTVAVNAGHGTEGGPYQKVYCHPDKSNQTVGASTKKGPEKSTAVSTGMNFKDGTPEHRVTLQMARILRDKLLAEGYDVLMIRDGDDVQLDNVARAVIANNAADIHIALHWDGDGLKYDKGAFYISVPDALKSMEPVASHWEQHERLGDSLIAGLETASPGVRIFSCHGHGCLDMDLTQMSYSTIPFTLVELGNQCSDHSDQALNVLATGLVAGVNRYFQPAQVQ